MLRTILVPLDGSAFAEHALPLARAIAARSGAALILTHVHVPHGTGVADPWRPDDTAGAEQRELKMSYLTTHSTALAVEDIDVSCNLLSGPVLPTLLEHAESMAADLVVMTTHGHGMFSRVWLGSVADAFVRHSPVPALLVRPPHAEAAATADAARSNPRRRVLIPLDGSALAEQIMPSALTLVQTMEAEVVLLRVVEPLPITGYTAAAIGVREEAMRLLCDDAHAYLRNVAALAGAHGRSMRSKVTIAQAPAQSILETANEEQCDMIALATHGRGGLRRLLLGSVADKVVRGAHMPVLVLRPC